MQYIIHRDTEEKIDYKIGPIYTHIKNDTFIAIDLIYYPSVARIPRPLGRG